VADEAAATAPTPVSTGPDSAFGRLVGAFVSPVRTFAAIAARPTFLVPLVLWTSMSFLVSELVLSKTDWRAMIAEGNSHRSQKLTEAQIDQIAESTSGNRWIWELLGAIAPTLVAAVTAGALWMSCQAFGWDVRFRQSLGVTAHAFLPGVVASVALFALLWGRQTIDPKGLDDLLRTSPAFLVSRQADGTLHSLLASLDLLSFWSMALIVLGLSSAAKVPRARMAILVVSLWGLYVLGKAGLGILLS
jgi:hypothetical protein